MNPTWPLRLFLDCSTAHLCPETRDKLEAQASGGERLIGATPYGWFLWVEEAPGPDCPSDLSRIMDYARGLGAEYVLFDRDAPENDVLPVFAE